MQIWRFTIKMLIAGIYLGNGIGGLIIEETAAKNDG